MTWLVVNADDLGLCEAVNSGIVRAHAEGIVTSASLMVRGAAAEAAVEAVAAHPRLGLGLHVDLGEWAYAAGAWRETRRVVDADDAVAVAAELERQLERFAELTGRSPDHLDSHQHAHRSEPLRSILGVRARELRLPVRHHGRVAYCGAFYGHPRIHPAALVELVSGLPDGATELCCHPATAPPPGDAYGAERVRELHALCHREVRDAIERAGVRLCTFDEALGRTASR